MVIILHFRQMLTTSSLIMLAAKFNMIPLSKHYKISTGGFFYKNNYIKARDEAQILAKKISNKL